MSQTRARRARRENTRLNLTEEGLRRDRINASNFLDNLIMQADEISDEAIVILRNAIYYLDNPLDYASNKRFESSLLTS